MRFGILSPEEVTRMKVCEVNNDQGVDNRTKLPTPGGVHDPLMGTMDRNTLCETCGCDYNDCPGHFGCITLMQPVFHPGYVTQIHKILRCVCFQCGRLRIRNKKQRDQIARIPSPHMRWKWTYMLCSKLKECRQINECNDYPKGIGCSAIQPTYTKDGLQLWRKTEGTRGPGSSYNQQMDPKTIITPEECMRIFKKIPDEDLRLLGMDKKYSRPEWMIIKALAVGPPPVRPSVEAGDGMRSNDDLTYVYTQIVRTNNELAKRMKAGDTDKTQQDIVRNLQLLVATLMDNNQPD